MEWLRERQLCAASSRRASCPGSSSRASAEARRHSASRQVSFVLREHLSGSSTCLTCGTIERVEYQLWRLNIKRSTRHLWLSAKKIIASGPYGRVLFFFYHSSFGSPSLKPASRCSKHISLEVRIFSFFFYPLSLAWRFRIDKSICFKMRFPHFVPSSSRLECCYTRDATSLIIWGVK